MRNLFRLSRQDVYIIFLESGGLLRGRMYIFLESGGLLTSWRCIFLESGDLLRGRMYIFLESGGLLTGWRCIFLESGSLLTGWMCIFLESWRPPERPDVHISRVWGRGRQRRRGEISVFFRGAENCFGRASSGRFGPPFWRAKGGGTQRVKNRAAPASKLVR